jgi:hypothetical protein
MRCRFKIRRICLGKIKITFQEIICIEIFFRVTFAKKKDGFARKNGCWILPLYLNNAKSSWSKNDQKGLELNTKESLELTKHPNA